MAFSPGKITVRGRLLLVSRVESLDRIPLRFLYIKKMGYLLMGSRPYIVIASQPAIHQIQRKLRANQHPLLLWPLNQS